MNCKNCGYEIDEASEQGFCDNCERAYQLGKEERMNECVYCEGVADFKWLDGGWYVCTGCVKEGQTDTKGEGEDE